MAKRKEVKVSEIKKWIKDFLKWYRKAYHLDEDTYKGTPYGAMNESTMSVLADIFNHMLEDLAEERDFKDKSKGWYDEFIRRG